MEAKYRPGDTLCLASLNPLSSRGLIQSIAALVYREPTQYPRAYGTSLLLAMAAPRNPKMVPFDQIKAAAGPPVFLQTVGNLAAPDAMIARWRHDGADVDIDESDIVRVTVNLQDGVPLRRQAGDGASVAYVAAVGSVGVWPAHTRTHISSRGPSDILEISLRESFLNAAAGGQFDCTALHNSRDGELRAAAMQLVVAATRSDPDDLLLLEAGVRRLADSLLNHSGRRPQAHRSGGLARAAHRRVNDLIHASIDDATTGTPTLDELASAAGLSVNHFIRAFRQQTGETPHRYVVLRRLERGIALLKKPRLSVAEVADEMGFATPAHFVATFRRAMGVTPGAFRTAVLG
jgi:AraC family transcriptional regulator